ncbi:hypothetical protein HSACCH_02539 [Halanaerobium saccharolyticum subsp. saccharolyticum DSM 6643]|uniref:Uncharacterized protein n=1 Tax=Halanaerobium saccharolyticum subsp. saccharolyticum DSM 6643 TaxID=1293054 RepID=M5E3Y0_9FIRM|nr:hypothetical protein HSACCH_02539 [Halanaerobium saccharolyticum subsp. saccharolyticum DSM 6643]
MPKNKIEVIYNPYDINKITEKSKVTVGKKYEHIFFKKTIITMGSLHYQKGQWHLIKTFSRLIKKAFERAKEFLKEQKN